MKNISEATSNELQEDSRHTQKTVQKSYFKARKKFGRIEEVDDKIYQVKVRLLTGGKAYAGQFIPVSNPWQQLVHDFGPLRKDLLVEIHYHGDQESFPEAKVIGLENETIAVEKERSDTDTGLWEIFSPGV